MALILRNGGSQSPDRWLKEPRNNQDHYSIDKSALTTDLDFSVYAESIAKLCNVSELERTYHIRHNDDRMLSSILKNPHS